jgi:antitoxin (DNA-binding transcriptional repressor) of toxin-antitoxin stability system
MSQSVSTTAVATRTLELLQQVVRTGEELVITDHGAPVVKLVRCQPGLDEALRALRGSVLRYDDPTEPVALEDWESLR